MGAVSAWQLVSAVTGGRVLSTGSPVESTNTRGPWAAPTNQRLSWDWYDHEREEELMARGHDRAGRDEEQVRAERARAVALFRYSLIREAADSRISTKQRGAMVRELASREHAGPFSTSRREYHGRASIAGSAGGASAGLTRWCPIRAGSPPARRSTCLSWRPH